MNCKQCKSLLLLTLIFLVHTAASIEDALLDIPKENQIDSVAPIDVFML